MRQKMARRLLLTIQVIDIHDLHFSASSVRPAIPCPASASAGCRVGIQSSNSALLTLVHIERFLLRLLIHLGANGLRVVIFADVAIALLGEKFTFFMKVFAKFFVVDFESFEFLAVRVNPVIRPVKNSLGFFTLALIELSQEVPERPLMFEIVG